MTVYIQDIASYQRGIDLAGSVGVAIKITEGTGYLNPYYAEQAAEAAHHGAFQPAYHFLHAGNAAAQAAFCHSHAGKTPLMLDVEPVYGATGEPSRRSEVSRGMEAPRGASAPTITDCAVFIDAYRKAGGITWLDYFPEWYWRQLGSPSMKPLTDRGMLLWSSNYSPYSDADSGAGWHTYAGRRPAIWQFTSTLAFGGLSAVDFSAFRGSAYAGKQDPASVAACLTELRALAVTGRYPVPAPSGDWTYDPPRSVTALVQGAHSVRLGWTQAPIPAGRPVPWTVVFIYKGHGACNRSNIVPGYPRPPVPGTEHLYGALDPAVTGTRQYTAHAVAVDSAGQHARDYAYATVQFEVSG
jgi:Glycosyl hydrolases family 25